MERTDDNWWNHAETHCGVDTQPALFFSAPCCVAGVKLGIPSTLALYVLLKGSKKYMLWIHLVKHPWVQWDISMDIEWDISPKFGPIWWTLWIWERSPTSSRIFGGGSGVCFGAPAFENQSTPRCHRFLQRERQLGTIDVIIGTIYGKFDGKVDMSHQTWEFRVMSSLNSSNDFFNIHIHLNGKET